MADVDNEKIERSYCRRCGGDRQHTTIAHKERPWAEEESGVEGFDSWSILECRGCETIAFVHTHWFSEDYEYDDDDGTQIIVHRDLYPPAPPRSTPEWESDLWTALPSDSDWIGKLHRD